MSFDTLRARVNCPRCNTFVESLDMHGGWESFLFFTIGDIYPCEQFVEAFLSCGICRKETVRKAIPAIRKMHDRRMIEGPTTKFETAAHLLTSGIPDPAVEERLREECGIRGSPELKGTVKETFLDLMALGTNQEYSFRDQMGTLFEWGAPWCSQGAVLQSGERNEYPTEHRTRGLRTFRFGSRIVGVEMFPARLNRAASMTFFAANALGALYDLMKTKGVEVAERALWDIYYTYQLRWPKDPDECFRAFARRY